VAHEWSDPTLTVAHVLTVPTRVGVERFGPATPTAPKAFDPQHHRVCVVRSAQVCQPPRLTAAQLVPAPTRVGTRRSVPSPAFPRPSWPSAFLPQHHTVWSVLVAHVWNWPMPTLAQVTAVPTRVGTARVPPGPGQSPRRPARAGRRCCRPSTRGCGRTDPARMVCDRAAADDGPRGDRRRGPHGGARGKGAPHRSKRPCGHQAHGDHRRADPETERPHSIPHAHRRPPVLIPPTTPVVAIDMWGSASDCCYLQKQRHFDSIVPDTRDRSLRYALSLSKSSASAMERPGLEQSRVKRTIRARRCPVAARPTPSRPGRAAGPQLSRRVHAVRRTRTYARRPSPYGRERLAVSAPRR